MLTLFFFLSNQNIFCYYIFKKFIKLKQLNVNYLDENCLLLVIVYSNSANIKYNRDPKLFIWISIPLALQKVIFTWWNMHTWLLTNISVVWGPILLTLCAMKQMQKQNMKLLNNCSLGYKPTANCKAIKHKANQGDTGVQFKLLFKTM